MSTRKAKDNSVFHQNRYASSPEFERGLLANLVAKRCALLDDPGQRELLWFIQYMSHQDGGLAAFAKAIMAKYPDRIQTVEMAAMNLKCGKTCDAATVKTLRICLEGYPLKGEDPDMLDNGMALLCAMVDGGTPAQQEEKRKRSKTYPANYQSDCFFDDCRLAAELGLEKWLSELCLNPETSVAFDCGNGLRAFKQTPSHSASKTPETGPWYFPTLIQTLRELLASVAQSSAGAVVTSLGRKVFDTLDYTAYGRGLTLMEGQARTGKSHAARVWCEQHPGQARFIEVPPGNDETAFFHALARGLGLGNFLSYKTTQIREKVESVILSAGLMMVLDEAHFLWPQMNPRYGIPRRMEWIKKWANDGVPIALISTPQFLEKQKAVEKSGWNSDQLTGRFSHYERLPAELSADDLAAVAKAVLPEASAHVLRVLALYARSSTRYLAAIDSISKRARYLAMKDERGVATTDDVRRAMKESVIPADTKLQSALAAGKPSKTMRGTPALDVGDLAAVPDPDTDRPAPRATTRQADDLPPLRRSVTPVLNEA